MNLSFFFCKHIKINIKEYKKIFNIKKMKNQFDKELLIKNSVNYCI